MAATWAPRLASVLRMRWGPTIFPRRAWKKLLGQTPKNSLSRICISSTLIRAALDSRSHFSAPTNCLCTKRANSLLPVGANKDARRASAPPGTWRRARKKRLWPYSIGCVRDGNIHRQVLQNFRAEADAAPTIRGGAAARSACGGFAVAPLGRGNSNESVRATRVGAQLVFVAGANRHVRSKPRTALARARRNNFQAHADSSSRSIQMAFPRHRNYRPRGRHRHLCVFDRIGLVGRRRST